LLLSIDTAVKDEYTKEVGMKGVHIMVEKRNN
jgi:hypothetical protein